MAHPSFPRTPSSANGLLQAPVGPGQRRSPDQDLGFRIRNDLTQALRFYHGIISQKHVALISGLLSFMRESGRIVWPSNMTLSKRLHDLPERTLSRQIKQLVENGFLGRRDSPNCKRMAIRPENPADKTQGIDAYGIDLAPFFARAEEFARRAAEARRQDAQLAAVRRRVSCLRGRLEELAIEPALVAAILRASRRPPPSCVAERLERLLQLEAQAEKALAPHEACAGREPPAPPLPTNGEDDEAAGACATAGMAANDGRNGRHIQTRDDRVLSSQPARRDRGEAPRQFRRSLEDGGCAGRQGLGAAPGGTGADRSEPPAPPPAPERRVAVKDYVDDVLSGFRHKLRAQSRPKLAAANSGSSGIPRVRSAPGQRSAAPPDPSGAVPNCTAVEGSPAGASPLPALDVVLAACPEGLALSGERPRSWSELFEAAWRIGGWLGIGERVLAAACASLGRDGLSITLFALCERLGTLREPAAYLQALCRRPGFHPGELLRQGAVRAAAP